MDFYLIFNIKHTIASLIEIFDFISENIIYQIEFAHKYAEIVYYIIYKLEYIT